MVSSNKNYYYNSQGNGKISDNSNDQTIALQFFFSLPFLRCLMPIIQPFIGHCVYFNFSVLFISYFMVVVSSFFFNACDVIVVKNTKNNKQV